MRRLPLYLSLEEVDHMLQALRGTHDPFKLRSALHELRKKHMDDEERLKELSARCRNSQFWATEEAEAAKVANEKAAHRSKRRKENLDRLKTAIVDLTPEQQQEIIRELRGKV